MTAPSTGHQEVFIKLTVRAKTLRQSELRKGRTLRASDLEIVYSDRFTLTTQLIKPDYAMIFPDAVPQFLWKRIPFVPLPVVAMVRLSTSLFTTFFLF